MKDKFLENQLDEKTKSLIAEMEMCMSTSK